MKTIYNLVKFKNELASRFEEMCLQAEINNKIDILNQLIQSNEEFPHLKKIDEIKNLYYRLIEDNQQKLNTLKDFLNQLDNEIETFATNELNTSAYMDNFVEGRIGTTQMVLDELIKDKISAKISQYSNCNYPGLQMLSREKHWIAPMVSCDPLYLTRNHFGASDQPDGRLYEMVNESGFSRNGTFLIDPVVDSTKVNSARLEELLVDYPDSYKQRVRLYIIKNRDFSILPQNQFGFILCWDNFDYLTYDIVQKYLQEAFRLLRPGGVFMFSYTNCDLELSALRVDYQIAAYCSSDWLLKSLEEIGYEVINLVDCDGPTHDPDLGLQEYPISWAEVRKPGKLTTVKRAQAQGLVLKK